MNRYKITYGPGYTNLPGEILADSFTRHGAFTLFMRRPNTQAGERLSTTLHSIASKAIVHVELEEENVHE